VQEQGTRTWLTIHPSARAPCPPISWHTLSASANRLWTGWCSGRPYLAVTLGDPKQSRSRPTRPRPPPYLDDPTRSAAGEHETPTPSIHRGKAKPSRPGNLGTVASRVAPISLSLKSCWSPTPPAMDEAQGTSLSHRDGRLIAVTNSVTVYDPRQPRPSIAPLCPASSPWLEFQLCSRCCFGGAGCVVCAGG
jgi:hypothetical protein